MAAAVRAMPTAVRGTSSLRAPQGSFAVLARNVRKPKTFSRQSLTVSANIPRRVSAVAAPPKYQVDEEVTHSLTAERLEVVKSLDNFAETELIPMLKPVEKSWQPQDFLPSPESPDFLDQIAELQKRAMNISDDHLVCLVGDMVTEEALPTYMNMLNTLDGTRDETGASDTAWARWTRAWTAEENRHGDLLNKYLWLTGRVDMKAVEVTIQNLIGSGMNPKTENNPYLGFIYTSFQERATKVSHGNTARFANDEGDPVLGKICGTIAADEGRHEIAYTKIVDQLFLRDEPGAMLAFGDMMKKQIIMPAHLMNDNQHKANTGRDLFDDFSSVAENVGVYTAQDYADIMEHLIKRWDIEKRALSGEAAEAQDYVCRLPTRVRRLAERSTARKKKNMLAEKAGQAGQAQFSWLFNREVNLL